jgi:hypothetical protein
MVVGMILKAAVCRGFSVLCPEGGVYQNTSLSYARQMFVWLQGQQNPYVAEKRSYQKPRCQSLASQREFLNIHNDTNKD